ncbi:MAG: PPC domain-containing protein [Phormidesmis sp.]
MTLGKLSKLLGSCGLGWLLLLTLPAQAQSNTVHQMGVLGPNDEQFSTGSYFDSYKIEGSEGQRVSVSLDSSEFDAFLGLFDSDGNLVASSDDAAADNPNSFISTTLPRNDTYTVVATSHAPQSSGDYRMSLRNFSPPPVARTGSSSGSWDGLSALVASPLGQMIMMDMVDSMFSFGGGSSAAASGGDWYPQQSTSSQPSHRPPAPSVSGSGIHGNGPSAWHP